HQVEAGGKAAPRAAEHQHARLGLHVPYRADSVLHLAQRFQAERVHLVGSVEGQARDAVLDIEQDSLVSHKSSGNCVILAGPPATLPLTWATTPGDIIPESPHRGARMR